MTLTPEQFNKLATKDEFNELKDQVSDLDEKFDHMLTIMDGIAKNVRDIKGDQAANLGAHYRFEERLEKLESKVKLVSIKS